jgi:hypothetical protein
MDSLWGSISYGGRDGIGRTQDFWKVFGGFIRDEREALPVHSPKSLQFSSGATSPSRHYTTKGDTVVSASLPVPHFYGVNQTDPTCLHRLTGLR